MGSGWYYIEENNLQEETNMTFGEAINAIKSGNKAYRQAYDLYKELEELKTILNSEE